MARSWQKFSLRHRRVCFCAVCTFFLLLSVPFTAEARPLLLFTGIPPLKHFIEAVGKERVQVVLLVPQGYDPHRFEPKGRSLVRLGEADGYVSLGVGFEKVWLQRFRKLYPRLVVIQGERGIPKRNGDPHIWLSPPLVKKIVIRIREGLQQLDPAGSDEYKQNAAHYISLVEEVDRNIRALLSGTSLSHRTILLFHPFLGYFASHYGFTQLSVEQEGKEAKPRKLISLIKEAKGKRIKTLFTEPGASPESAETLAKSLGAEVKTLNPLAENWEENMEEIARSLADTFTSFEDE